MKELKPSGLFYVPVPMDAHNAMISHTAPNQGVSYNTNSTPNWVCEKLPKGKWELIGSVTAEHIDFDVEPYTNATGFQGREILLQMLKANDVHFVNPYREKDPIKFIKGAFTDQERKRLRRDSIKWQQAESKLVEKILILKPL